MSDKSKRINRPTGPGKGDTPRKIDKKSQYDKNFDEIKWKSKKK